MFTTVRYFIKTSIVFLITGILTGLLMSILKNIVRTGYYPEIISAHTHIILIGAVMMMIMGVALWFFPRAEKTDKKYNPDLILAVYWVMTISTAARFIFEFTGGFYYYEWSGIAATAASALQVTGMALFFYSIWGRIRPVGSQYREAKGEKF